MRYLGEEKLTEFVFKGNPPLFEDFIEFNKHEIPIWCSQSEIVSPSSLYSTWKKRFTLKLVDHEKIHLISDRYIRTEKTQNTANMIKETLNDK